MLLIILLSPIANLFVNFFKLRNVSPVAADVFWAETEITQWILFSQGLSKEKLQIEYDAGLVAPDRLFWAEEICVRLDWVKERVARHWVGANLLRHAELHL